MLDWISGVVKGIDQKSVLLEVSGLGISVLIAESMPVQLGQKIELWTNLAWSESRGPVLYGFSSPETKSVFLCLLDCPKVGPQTALSIVAKVCQSAKSTAFSDFLGAIGSQDQAFLENIVGLSPKISSILIANLKTKAQKVLQAHFENCTPGQAQSGVASNAFGDVAKALRQMGYSEKEVLAASRALIDNQERDFAKMVKLALKVLSGH